MSNVSPPKPRPPTAALSTLALVLSFVCGGCTWASNYGPLFSLALAALAWALAWRRPDRFAGTGRAAAALLVSSAFAGMALTMRPYVNQRGELRYRSTMEGMEEPRAIGTLRNVASVQAVYAEANGGFYDTLECLRDPRSCLVNVGTLPPRLDWQPRSEDRAFAFTFHAGPRPKTEEIRGRRVSGSSMTTFAFVAAPKTRHLHGYCVDDTGIVRRSDKGRTPRVVNGRCDPSVPEMR